MSLVDELKRRKVFTIGTAYLVVAWVLIQVTATVAPQLDFPIWVPRLITFVLLLGFPIALVFAWVFDLTPEGVKVESGSRGTRVVLAVAVGLAALAVGWYFKGQPSYREGDVPAETGSPSVAVLPFANMSGNPEEEYFSDGMTEELLNVLAKIPELKIAARTSVFEFKGKGGDVREIGRKLGVSHIVEGSIRRDAGQVRVTAQLIRVADGFHVWSESYDRELQGVFALQDELARRIGEQLQSRLGVARLPAARAAIDPAAYDEYLKGRALFRKRQNLGGAIVHLEAATRGAPDFAAAWATLSLAHDVIYWYTLPEERAQFGDILDQMKRTAGRAAALDPDSALTLHALANLARGETRYADAERLYVRSVAADPTYADAREDYSEFLEDVGRYAEAEREMRALVTLDPVVPVYWFRVAALGWGMGRRDLAEEGMRHIREIDPRWRWGVVSDLIYEGRNGNLEGARAAADEAARFAPEVAARDVLMFRWADRVAGIDEAAVRALVMSSVEYSVYAALRGDEEAFFAPFEGAQARSVRYKGLRYMSSPAARAYLASARGKRMLADFGFVAYWRERGWPPQCRPVGDADFECGTTGTKG